MKCKRWLSIITVVLILINSYLHNNVVALANNTFNDSAAPLTEEETIIEEHVTNEIESDEIISEEEISTPEEPINVEPPINVSPSSIRIINENNLKLNFSLDLPKSQGADPSMQMLKTNESSLMTVTAQPTWSKGQAQQIRVHINLPYFVVNGDTVEQVNYKTDKGVMCVPEIASEVENWYVENENLPYHEGEIIITRPFIDAGTLPSFKVNLKFFGDVPENTIAEITGWVEYSSFDGNNEIYWATPGNVDESAVAFLISSNLVWSTQLTALTPQIPIWQRFNYMPFEFVIENVSDTEASTINGFSINLTAPHKSSITLGGVLDRDMTMWEYNNNSPILNNLGDNIGQLFTGVPEQGGVLIYDITDSGVPVGDPLPYIYTGSGQFSVDFRDSNAGLLYSPSKVASSGDPSIKSKRVYRIEIPFPNLFLQLPMDLILYSQPTIYFGSGIKRLAFSKYREAEFTAIPPDQNDIEIKKTPQPEAPYFNTLASYYVTDVINNSNIPYFNPYIIDTLDNGIGLKSIRYIPDTPTHTLEDYFAQSDAIQYEIYTKDKDDIENTTWYSLPDFSGPIMLNENSAWEITGIDAIISNKVSLLASDFSVVTFTKRIRMNLKSKINSGERLPGKLQLEGLMTLAGKISNTAEIYWDYKYDATQSESSVIENYVTEHKGPAVSQAILDVIKPEPIISSKGLIASSNVTGNNIEVGYNEINGYRFYLGNNANASMTPAILNIVLPVTLSDGDISGFLADEIILPQQILQYGTVEKIEIKDISDVDGSNIITLDYSSSNLTDDLIISKSQWCPDPSAPNAINYPDKIAIHFTSFSNKLLNPPLANPEPNEIYVQVTGVTDVYGTLTSTAAWETPFPNGTSVSTFTTQTLTIKKPIPKLLSKGVNIVQNIIGDNINVSYAKKNGYRYYLGNDGRSSLFSSRLEISLPVDVPDISSVNGVNGFLSDSIFLSEALLNVGEIEKIELQDARDPTALNIATVPITTVPTTGGMLLQKSSWCPDPNAVDAVNHPTKIIIYFKYFTNIMASLKVSAPEENDIYVELIGVTNRYGSLTSNANWISDLSDKTSVNATASQTLKVLKPVPILSSKGVDIGKNKIGDNIEVPYDKINAYNYYPGNSSISPLYSTRLDISLPVDFSDISDPNSVNGFLTESIFLSEKLLSIGEIDKIELQGVSDSSGLNIVSVPIENDLTTGGMILEKSYWCPDPTAVGAVNYPNKLVIYFKYFAGTDENIEVSAPEANDIYVQIRGITKRYENLSSTANWTSNLSDKTSVNATASQMLKVAKPMPILSSKGVNITDNLIGNNIEAPYYKVNGYNYYPGNSSVSSLYSNKLEMSLFVDAPDMSVPDTINGFLVEEIFLSENILEVGELEKIQLQDILDPTGSTIVTLPINTVPETGGLLLKKSDWCPNPEAVGAVSYPSKIVVYFKSFADINENPEVSEPEANDIYIQLRGMTTRYGELPSTSNFSSYLDDGTLSYALATQKLIVTKPNPKIKSSAIYYDHINESSSRNTQNYNWQQIPYGRSGTYRFELSNPSSSAVKSGIMELNFQINSRYAENEAARGFKAYNLRLSKQLLDVMQLKLIELYDVDYDTDNSLKYVIGINDEGKFYEMKEVDGRYEFTDTEILTDSEGNFALNNIPIKYLEKAFIHIDGFNSSVMDDTKICIETDGYLDNLPYTNPTSSSYNYSTGNYKWEPTGANNIATLKWDTEFNIGSVLSVNTTVGFCVMAASIDMDFFARFSDGRGLGGDYSAVNTRNYEYGKTSENFYTDIGYKGIGSYTVSFIQRNAFVNNVQMNLKVETLFPYDDFELYYMTLSPEIKPYLRDIEIYRMNENNEEYLWQTVNGTLSSKTSDWIENGRRANWFRINTLNADNNTKGELFTTVDVDMSAQNHPYYRNPFTEMFVPRERVTRIIANIEINKAAADIFKKAISPDFGNSFENIIDYTGRFTKVGDIGAQTVVTYDFGEGETLRAGLEPNDTLVNRNKYVAKMMDGDNISYGDINRWGTSDALTHFRIKEPTIPVYKGGKEILTTASNGAALSPDTLFGKSNSFYISFNNGTTIGDSTSSGNNRIYEWSGKYTFADKVYLTDTLPIPTTVIGEDNPYEGFLVRKISLINDAIDFLSITINLNDGSSYKFTPDDFTGNPVEIGFSYSTDTTSVIATNIIDVPAGFFPERFIIEAGKMSGNGDNSAEILGILPNGISNNADVRIDGDVFTIQYQTNTVQSSTVFDDNSESFITKTDSAMIKAESPTLQGSISVTSNIAGENQYVYNPRDTDQPNLMKYYFNLYNPIKTGAITKASIGGFDIMSGTLPAGYQMQYIEMPSEFFGGSNWTLKKFTLTTPTQSNIDITGEFEANGEMHVIKILDLYDKGILERPTASNGYISYRINSFSATLEVVDKTDKGSYLSVANDATSATKLLPDKDNIIISGVYAETLESKYENDIWDEDSRTTLGKTSWTYSENRTLTPSILAYSYSKYTTPAIVSAATSSSVTDTIYNLVAPIFFDLSQTKTYDVHNNIETKINYDSVMPGDRADVVITVRNTGDKSNFNDGFTYLQNPLLRYTVPKGMRIVNWSFGSSDSLEITESSPISCWDITNTQQSYAGQNLSEITPYTKDLSWEFIGKLEEGEAFAIKLTVEITDEFTTTYPISYQGVTIEDSGRIYVSGGTTHGFRPFLAGNRSSSANLPSYCARATNYSLNPTGLNSVAGLSSSLKIDDTFGLRYKYVNVSSPTISIAATDRQYNNVIDNITSHPLQITVGGLKNDAHHENVKYAVEIVPDYNLTGFRLAKWPVVNYPAGFIGEFTAPQIYFKTIDKALGLSQWIEVTDPLTVPVAENIYALRIEYGILPQNSPTNFDNIIIDGIARWSKDAVLDSLGTYTIKPNVSTFFYHRDHIYPENFASSLAGKYPSGDTIAESPESIGRQANSSIEIYREAPSIEIDTQIFGSKDDAEKIYTPSDINESIKTTYRPNDEVWYKTTVQNYARNNINSQTGTGPLLDPIILDKVPEYIIMPQTISADIATAIASGDLSILWYNSEGTLKNITTDIEYDTNLYFRIPTVTVEERTGQDVFGAQYVPNYINTAPTLAANAGVNSGTIQFYIYKFDFSGQQLERNERIEIQYRAKVRNQNLPLMTMTSEGEDMPAYFPRMGEYYRYSNIYSGRYVEPEYRTGATDSTLKSPMDGDFLIHDVGITGTPNPDIPTAMFLTNSLTWIPGHNSSYESGTTGHGDNGNILDYDIKTGKVQQIQFTSDKNRNQSYTISSKQRDMYQYALLPRISNFNDLNKKAVNDTVENINIVWSQSRMHLKKAWLYAASEMISDMSYKDNKNTYTSSDKYSVGSLYSKDAYTYGAEYNQIFTVRQHAVNYGDSHLDGVEFIYVLPKGTEPVFNNEGTIDIMGYYDKTPFSDQSVIQYEIIQRPDSANPEYKAPKALMEARNAINFNYYNEEGSVPWVIKITVNSPLTAWWNRFNELSIPNTANTYQMYTEFLVRVTEENNNEHWYDKIYATSTVSDSGQYMQVYSYDYIRGQTRSEAGIYDGQLFPDSGSKGMLTLPSDYLSYSPSNANYSLTFYSAQTPYIRGLNYYGVRNRTENELYITNGDQMRAKKPMIRLWTDSGDNSISAFFHEVREEAFNLNIHVGNKYIWNDQPLNTGSNPYNYEVYNNNIRTNGGLNGTFFAPVITNILPYGIAPLDITGNIYDGTNPIDYKMSGLELTQGNDFSTKWDLEVDFVTHYDVDDTVERYRLTWIPKDMPPDELIQIPYDQQLDIQLKVKPIKYPQNKVPDANGIEDISLNKNWQYNRTYVTSKRDKFLFLTEPDNSPYKVGNSPRSGVTDKRPDSQGTNGNIKINVLGIMQVGMETDDINIEDYVSRTPKYLSPEKKDFNKNDKNKILWDDTIVADKYITNTLTLFTKGLGIFASKAVNSTQDNMIDQSPLSLSYGNNFWYHIEINNNIPEGITTNEDYEYYTGTLQESYIMVYDWLPEQISYNNNYSISYADPLDPSNIITLTPSQLAEAGWEIEIYDNTSIGYDENKGHLTLFKIKTPREMGAFLEQALPGDLASGKGFTLNVNALVTGVGLEDSWNDPDEREWRDILNKVYVNVEPFVTDEYSLSKYLNTYTPYIKESYNNDYNENGIIGDEFAASEAEISIRKPAGAIRWDTNKNKILATSGAYVSPTYTATEEVLLNINEVRNVSSDVAELIIMAHSAAAQEYTRKENGTDWISEMLAIKTGVWEIPQYSSIEDFRLYTYYSTENEDFYTFGDRTKWVAFGDTEGYDLTINTKVPLPMAARSTAKKIIFVIRSDSPDIKPVPMGTRLSINADPSTPEVKEISQFDPPGISYDPIIGQWVVDDYKRNFVPYNDSVIENSAGIIFDARVLGSTQRMLYNSISLWGRYSRKSVAMLSKSSDRYYISTSNPVLDINIATQYFRYSNIDIPIPEEERLPDSPEYETRRMFHWDDSIIVNPNSGKHLKYTIELKNVSEKEWHFNYNYKEDVLINPAIVNTIPNIIDVDINNFAYVPADSPDNVLNANYISDMDIDARKNDPKWTWEIKKENPDSNSHLDFIEVVAAENLTENNPFIGNISTMDSKLVKWVFDGVIYPGDSLVVSFIGRITGVDLGNTERTLQNVAYGFNQNGTMIAFTDDNGLRDNPVGINSDKYDLNLNGRTNDKYIRTTSNAFTFSVYTDFPKAKRAYSDLNIGGSQTPNVSAATEGSIYTFVTSISNPQEAGFYYKYPVIFDILPHLGDTQSVGSRMVTTEPYTARERSSKWSGILQPESITLIEEGGAGILPPTTYDVWVGPITGTGTNMMPLDISYIPDLQERSDPIFFTNVTHSSTGDNFIRNKNFVKLDEIQSLKITNTDLYNKLIKNIKVMWVQMKDKNYKFDGRKKLTLTYDMRAPLNLPFLNEVSGIESQNVNDFVAWNSFASWYNDSTLQPGESNMAGVYLNAPADRCYIGDYIWLDHNFNGLQDEAQHATDSNGRYLPSEWNTSDPGLNGVLVELLTTDGFNADIDGNRIITAEGKHYIVDENGMAIRDEFGELLEGSKPVSYVTTSDYAERNGFYILTNIKSGSYRLRYTFPREYKEYGVTTATVHNNIGVEVYGYGATLPTLPGETEKISDTLVIYTKPFNLETNREDAYYVDFDIGINMPEKIDGIAWVDVSSTPSDTRNGIYDTTKAVIENATVTLRKTDGSIVTDMQNKEAIIQTDQNGKFYFNYLNPKDKYYITVDSNNPHLIFPTPILHTTNPLENGNDNDIYQTTSGVNRSNVFDLATLKENLKNIIGIGFTSTEKNIIQGIVWDDANRDGFKDIGLDFTENQEKGIPNVKVKLRRFMLEDDGSWTDDTNFGTEGIIETTTDSYGQYFFDELDSIVFKTGEEVDFNIYGYEIFMDTLPQGYTPTLLYKWNEEKTPPPFEQNKYHYDSDLNKKTGTMSASYIILAEKNEQGIYDPSIATMWLGNDAGLVTWDTGSISGMLWDDKNKNGIRESIETKIANMPIYLESFDDTNKSFKPVKISNGTILNFNDADYSSATQLLTITTDENGNYMFDNLPLADKITREPYIYRIFFEKPAFSELTVPNAGTDKNIDSDFFLDEESNFVYSQEYILSPLEDETLKDNKNVFGEKYNLFEALHVTNNDAGLIYPEGKKISGFAFNDINKNGIFDTTESKLPNRNVYLYKYDFYDKHWYPHTDLNGKHKIETGKNGDYEYYVDIANYEYNSPYILEQNKFIVVFEKSEEESFTLYKTEPSELDNNVISTTEIAEDIYSIPIDDYTGITEVITFGNTIYNDALSKDVIDLNNLDAVDDVKFINCGYIISLSHITGYFWNDKNRDGFRDTDLVSGYDEPGIQGVDVYLKRYTFDGSKFAPDKNFGTISTKTSVTGQYKFDELESGYYDEENNLILYGYDVFVESLPDGYTFTKPHVVIPEKTPHPISEYSQLYDSNLIETGELTTSPLIFTDTNTGINVSTVIKGIDAGLMLFDKGNITGVAWEDKNRNGMKDADEQLLQGINVYLEVKLPTNSKDGYEYYPVRLYGGGKIQMPGDNKYEASNDIFATTNSKGEYEINNIPIGDPISRMPYTYRLYTINDEHLEFTLANNEDKTKQYDNVFAPLVNENDNYGFTVYDFMLTKQLTITNIFELYNFAKATDKSNVDLGLTYPSAIIKGKVWEDINSNGLQDENEIGLEGRTLYLYKKNHDTNVFEPSNDIYGNNTATTDFYGNYKFYVDVAEYNKNSPHLLKQNQYRIVIEKRENETFTTPFVGDDETINSKFIPFSDTEQNISGITNENDIALTETFALSQTTKNKLYKYEIADLETVQSNENVDCGIIMPKSKISGLFFNDLDRNGIKEKDEPPITDEITVYLQRYIFDTASESWTHDDSFDIKNTTTKDTGMYVFDNLENMKVTLENGIRHMYIYGYEAYVKSIPKGYAITSKPKTNVIQDQTVNKMSEDGYLTQEYLTLTVQNEHGEYEPGLYSIISDLDGGIAKFDKGTLGGIAWNDENKDGLIDPREEIISDIIIRLEVEHDVGKYMPVNIANDTLIFPEDTHYVETLDEFKGETSDIQQIMTTFTDSYGKYYFEDLPIAREEYPYQPYKYRVSITKEEEADWTTLTAVENGNFLKPDEEKGGNHGYTLSHELAVKTIPEIIGASSLENNNIPTVYNYLNAENVYNNNIGLVYPEKNLTDSTENTPNTNTADNVVDEAVDKIIDKIKDIPQTGDILLYVIVLLIISGFILMVFIVGFFKKNKKK